MQRGDATGGNTDCECDNGDSLVIMLSKASKRVVPEDTRVGSESKRLECWSWSVLLLGDLACTWS
jgi:hypothetical protein